MKRVHDHKEEPTSLTGSPDVTGESQGPRKTGGRKRKASGPIPEEPVAQRQMATPVAPAPAQALSMPQVGYQQVPALYQQIAPPPADTRKTQHRQRLYSQWADQRELLARQMDFVRGPDDEANLHRLSQNIEELRRLSQEARRG